MTEKRGGTNWATIVLGLLPLLLTIALATLVFGLKVLASIAEHVIGFGILVAAGYLCYFLWLFLANISEKLEGAARRWCLVFIAVLFPAALSLYFFKDVRGFAVSFEATFAPSFEIRPLITAAVIAFVGLWLGGAAKDAKYPVRWFATAAVIIFIFNVGSHQLAEGEGFSRGKELPSWTGEFGVIYLFHTAICYLAMLGAMLARMRS